MNKGLSTLKQISYFFVKQKYEIIVFLAGSIEMSLELVAARIFAPYVGTTTLVWTIIIGMILIFMSLGYHLGGRMADKKHNILFVVDTGTKMIHIGKNTKSTIISKGISAGRSQNAYRGLVKVASTADNARNYSSCDSLLLGSKCGAHTFPYMDVHNSTAVVEHEATTSKISEDQLFYCNQRGINTEEAVSLIVNGYAKEVINKLPMEFAVEAQKLLGVSLEGSVG